MISLVLVTALCIYEIAFYHQKKISWFLLWIVFSVISFISVYFFNWSFVIWVYTAYVIHHHFLLKEEKLYAVLLTGITALFLYFCMHNEVICLGCAGMYALLEYISQRIMKREEDRTVIYQNKLMKQQIDEIENMYQTMRDWRHDYHNHLQSLKSYLHLEQYDAMENYLDDLESELDSIDTLYHSGNLQIDAVLDAKLSIAKKDGITIKCDAEVPGQLYVNEIDLCVIIGNLLDNAVESCRKVENIKDRFIRVYIGVLKKQLYISVTNATNEDVKIRTNSYFTHKRGDHGRGLKRVDNIVKKYNGWLNRQNEPGVFATEIVLPL